MGRLVYAPIASLDGYVADEHGRWDWSVPSADVHAAVNELSRAQGTWLLGRRMYDVLVAWETIEADEPELREFAKIWRGTDKVVYSRSLEAPRSERTRIEHSFDPDAVRRMKHELAHELSIGGPELAAQAFRAGLVDDVHLFVSPIVVGGGSPALPSGVTVRLELAAERPFANGVVHLHYRVPRAVQITEGSAGADAVSHRIGLRPGRVRCVGTGRKRERPSSTDIARHA